MANTTTTVNHSDLPCTCTSMDQYVDGLCPGCIEAADRDADLKEHVDAQAAREPHPFPEAMIEDAFEGDDVTEGDDSDIDPPFDYSAPEDDSDPYADDHKGYDHPEFDD
jgi:hypothetical protein